MTPEINRISWTDPSGRLKAPVRIAFVSDLHDSDYGGWIRQMDGVDWIAVVGDLSNRHTRALPRRAESFLREAAGIAPVVCSLGNHEQRMRKAAEWRAIMENAGAMVLDNRVWHFRDDLAVGGFTSQKPVRDTAVVDALAKASGMRLMLCHHPEYFRPWILPTEIELTLSGHAHGGQARLFGHGLYAPGQGLFPKWTSGFYYGNRLLVSRGVGSHGFVPRVNNPCELILLTLLPSV